MGGARPEPNKEVLEAPGKQVALHFKTWVCNILAVVKSDFRFKDQHLVALPYTCVMVWDFSFFPFTCKLMCEGA